MKAIVALLCLTALLISHSTTVVYAFHLRPSCVGITTCASCGYHRPLKIVLPYDKYGDKIIGGSQSPRLLANLFDQSFKKEQGRIRRLFRTFCSFLKHVQRILSRIRGFSFSVALFSAIYLTVLPAWAAGSNGRMGGSFGRSNRYHSPPIGRNIQPSKVYGRIPAPTRFTSGPFRVKRNRIYHNFHQANGEQVAGDGVSIMTNSDGRTSYVRKINTHPFSNSRFSVSDVVSVSCVTAVVTKGVMKRKFDRKKYNDDNASFYPLGPGISVWRMTACLNVPNLNDPTSIVRRLQTLAETTSTKTRKGLQEILAKTSLELLRQLDKGSVISVESYYDHYRSSDQAVIRAERQYNRISTRERSKFDRESWSSYNDRITIDDIKEQEGLSHQFTSEGTPSLALVQIHLVIEGDAMKSFGQRQMEIRRSFQAALVQLSGDVSAVEDCVLAGEILWAPQRQEADHMITEEDIYSSYPTLWPLE